MSRRIPLTLVRLYNTSIAHNRPIEDPNRLVVVNTNMPIRSMSGMYKTLDDNSVVELDIDIIWDKFIRLNPQFKKQFSDPMMDIVDSTTIFNRSITVDNGDISYTTHNKYLALLIILDDNAELQYSLGGVVYYKMVNSNKVVVIPPEICSLYSPTKIKGIIITI